MRHDDCGSDEICPEVPGARVYSCEGDEFGISQGVSGSYSGEAGNSRRVCVVWSDGNRSFPTVKGILFKKGKWKIC